MSNMTRRSVIKQLSVLPLAASGASLLSCSKAANNGPPLTASSASKGDKTPRLNVVLHGMFAMIFDYTQSLASASTPLLLMTPKVDMHVYGAGTWKQEAQLDEGKMYTLKGVKCNTNFDIHGAEYATNPLINLTAPLPSGTAPYCSFQLPFPDDIVPLRILKRTSGKAFFLPGSTSYAKQIDGTTELPMIYVLMYENFDGTAIELTSKNDTFWQADSSPVKKLHLFADPPFAGVSGAHMGDALKKMNGMFRPNLGIQFDDTNPLLQRSVDIDSSTGHDSIDRCEEATLAEERQGLCTPLGKGGAPRNCMKLMLSISSTPHVQKTP